MTQLKRVARYVERSAQEKTLQHPAQEPSRAHLEVHVDSDWAWRHSNASVHVWSDCAARTTLAQTQLNSTITSLDSVVQKVSTTHSRGGCAGLGLQSLFADWNLKLQLSLHTDSSRAKAVASRRGAGRSTRHVQTRMLWLQERAAEKHLRVVKVATGSNPADMLTKALGRSKVEEFWAEIGQTEPHAMTVGKKPKEVKKLKKIKFSVEAMEMEPKDAEIKNEAKDAKFAKVKNESLVDVSLDPSLWLAFFHFSSFSLETFCHRTQCTHTARILCNHGGGAVIVADR